MSGATRTLATVARAVAAKSRTAMSVMLYSAFVASIGVTLTDAQRVATRLAYDRAPIEEADHEMAKTLFGAVIRPEDVPANARTVVVAMCGGRGGKSYSLEALRLLHLAFVVNLDQPGLEVAPGEIAVALITANDTRNARQVLRFINGALEHHSLADCVVGEPGVERTVIRRPDGHLVAFEVLPATAGGGAVRARTLVGAVMDEAAFFRDENAAVNDDEIYKAIVPRILPGGMLIVASTPWAQSGLLFRLFTENHGHPKTALAIHASTILLRPAMKPTVEAERERDPDNARREYDAIPFGKGTGVFFDPTALGFSMTSEKISPREGDEIIAAADLGFRVNASALVIGLRRAGVTWLVEVLERRPEPDKPLEPSVVAQEFGERLAYWNVDTLIADAFYREDMAKLFAELRVGADRHPFPVGLVEAPSGNEGKTTTHLSAKAALADGKVRIPEHARLLKQLREIVSVPISGGSLSIRSPQWRTGEHGDIASAAVLVIAAKSGSRVDAVKDTSFNARIREETAAHWEAEQDRLDQQRRDEYFETSSSPEDSWAARFGRIA